MSAMEPGMRPAAFCILWPRSGHFAPGRDGSFHPCRFEAVSDKCQPCPAGSAHSDRGGMIGSWPHRGRKHHEFRLATCEPDGERIR